MDLIIRKATISDAKEIANIHVKMWQHAYRGQVPDNFLDNMSVETRLKKWEQDLENPKPNTYTYVAELQEKVVGWVTGGVSRDGDLPKDVGELYAIYIHPDYASKGIGSELMSKLLETLKGDKYSNATLWVLDTNKKTREWYERRGWKPEGKTKTEKRETFDLHEVRYVKEL